MSIFFFLFDLVSFVAALSIEEDTIMLHWVSNVIFFELCASTLRLTHDGLTEDDLALVQK